MAIDPTNPDHRQKLQRAVAFHFSQAQDVRTRRETLHALYKGRPNDKNVLLATLRTEAGTYVNLIQAFVLGQAIALAWRGPKWSIKARTMEGAGFDRRIQNFIGRYGEILELPRILRQSVIDSCFGWAAVKIVNSLPPKGVTCPYAPRAYRIEPNSLILDGTANSFDECAWMGDTYLVPLEEAKQFFPAFADRLLPWPGGAMQSMGPGQFQNNEAYAQEYTRLIDLYFPTSGVIGTWPAQSDRFGEILDTPIAVNDSPINPYEILSLTPSPDVLEEMARLDALKDLHLLANDMLFKAARQARQSKRNPVAALGSDMDLATVLDKADGEAALIEDLSKIGMWTLPGADPAVVNMANFAMTLFSQNGGNLDVALGNTSGAQTARQTQSLIQQINARQSVDREAYERFASNIAKKLATLAFPNETLAIEYREQIPGTTYTYSAGWAPPQKLPRPASIDDFTFEVTPYSTKLRTPEERLKQLLEATGQIVQLMQVAASGAPLNLEAIIADFAEAYDQVPNLMAWWTGEQPDPVQQAADGGQYVAQPGPNGSTVSHEYSSDAQAGGGEQGFSANNQGVPPGGLAIPQVGGV